MNELEILKLVSSDFTVNMRVAFQDREFLYLGLDLFKGGDLRYHIIKNRTFNEAQSMFMVGCMLVGASSFGAANSQVLNIFTRNE